MPHHRTCKQKAEEDGRKRQAALQKLRGPLYSPPFHLQRPRELAYSQGQSDESVRDLCTVQRRHRFTQVNHLLLAPRTLLDRSKIRCQSPGTPRPRTFDHSSESHGAACRRQYSTSLPAGHYRRWTTARGPPRLPCGCRLSLPGHYGRAGRVLSRGSSHSHAGTRGLLTLAFYLSLLSLPQTTLRQT